jgi:hypothetical protein
MISCIYSVDPEIGVLKEQLFSGEIKNVVKICNLILIVLIVEKL